MMNEDTLTEAPCIDRINVEPAILFGLSSSESLWVIAGAMLLCLPLAAMVMAFSMVGAVVAGFGLPMLIVYLSARHMAGVKRNRPDMYYLHLMRAWLARMHMRRTRFITTDGDWDLGRTLP